MADCGKPGHEQLGLGPCSRCYSESLEARIAELEAELQGIASAKFREWGEGMNNAEEFVKWAQSRAKYILEGKP